MEAVKPGASGNVTRPDKVSLLQQVRPAAWGRRIGLAAGPVACFRIRCATGGDQPRFAFMSCDHPLDRAQRWQGVCPLVFQLPENRLRPAEAVVSYKLPPCREDGLFDLPRDMPRTVLGPPGEVLGPSLALGTVALGPLEEPGPRAAERAADVVNVLAVQVAADGKLAKSD